VRRSHSPRQLPIRERNGPQLASSYSALRQPSTGCWKFRSSLVAQRQVVYTFPSETRFCVGLNRGSPKKLGLIAIAKWDSAGVCRILWKWGGGPAQVRFNSNHIKTIGKVSTGPLLGCWNLETTCILSCIEKKFSGGN